MDSKDNKGELDADNDESRIISEKDLVLFSCLMNIDNTIKFRSLTFVLT